MDFLSNKYVLIGLAVGLILLGGFYVWFDLRTDDAPSQIATSTPPTPQEMPKIEINAVPNIPVPALPWPVEAKNGLSGETKDLALKNIESLTLDLKKDSTLYSSWMDLALYRRSIGDLTGARDAWVYASALRPDDFIPPHNLGDLYTYDLVDLKRAESYYFASLKLDPTVIMVYQKLYELYRFKMKDEVKAEAILKQGIEKNPTDSARLQSILQEWKPTIGL